MTTIREVLKEMDANTDAMLEQVAKREQVRKGLLSEAESLQLTISRLEEGQVKATHLLIWEHRARKLEEKTEAFRENTKRQEAIEWAIVAKMKSVIAGLQVQAAAKPVPVKEPEMAGRWLA